MRPKQAAFLQAFIVTGTITTACEAAQITRKTHYDWLSNSPEYAGAFADAEKAANELMIAEARRRGVDGVYRMKFHQGSMIMIPAKEGDFMAEQRWEPCDQDDPGATVYERKTKKGVITLYKRQVWMKPYIEHEYSDRLLEFLIKAKNPEFRDKHEIEHTGGITETRRVIVVTKDMSDDQQQVLGFLSSGPTKRVVNEAEQPTVADKSSDP